jgi:hypothetical protein
MKRRMRVLTELLADHATDPAFAKAVDALRRAAKRGDHRQDPSPELRALLQKAEDLAKSLVR